MFYLFIFRCQIQKPTTSAVKVAFNVHGATFSKARVIFPTPHLMLSPEAISNRSWTRVIGATDQEVATVVLSFSAF